MKKVSEKHKHNFTQKYFWIKNGLGEVLSPPMEVYKECDCGDRIEVNQYLTNFPV